RIMVTASNPTHGKDDKLTAKKAAKRDAEHGAPPFLLLDVLERGYVKLRKGSLAKWQGRNSGMEIRQLLLENLAEEDAEDYEALTDETDNSRAQAAGIKVAAGYREARSFIRSKEVWNEDDLGVVGEAEERAGDCAHDEATARMPRPKNL
ncbi:hypothetical protein CF328_g8934, partial [Tilletia controversa]